MFSSLNKYIMLKKHPATSSTLIPDSSKQGYYNINMTKYHTQEKTNIHRVKKLSQPGFHQEIFMFHKKQH